MSEIASAFVSLLPSAKGFGPKLESEVGGDIKGAGKRLGSGFGKAFALAGGVLAAAGVGSFLKGSIDEAREAQKVGAATTAIIKATGGAANLTADQVGNLAGALSNKIGVDDEVIQAGANLLLTFKNVRDEAGKGADVFTRATKAGADLAAAGFGSIEGNAKTLGKALNDPLKGITALTKSGVTFTDKQKEQIKTLTESGRILKAQKIILGEVEAQVGGTAEATATSGERAAVAFGNLKEQIGTGLLPILDKLLNKIVLPGISALSSAFAQGGISGVGKMVANKIAAALPVIKAKLAEWGAAFWEWVKAVTPPLLVRLGKVLRALGAWLRDVALPAIAQKLVAWGKALTEWILPRIPPMLKALGELAGRLYVWLLDVGLPGLLKNLGEWGKAFLQWIGPKIPPLLLELGKLLAALVAWIVTVAIPKWYSTLFKLGKALLQWIGPQIPKVISALGELFVKMYTWLTTVGLPAFRARMLRIGKELVDWVPPQIPKVIKELGKLFTRINLWIITVAVPKLAKTMGKVGPALVMWITPRIPGVILAITTLFTRLGVWISTKAAPKIAGKLASVGLKAFEKFNEAAVNVVLELPGRLVAILSTAAVSLYNAGKNVGNAIISGIKRAFADAGDFLIGLVPSPADFFRRVTPKSARESGRAFRSFADEFSKTLNAAFKKASKKVKFLEDLDKKVSKAVLKARKAAVAQIVKMQNELAGLVGKFKSLSSSISDAFKVDLFSGGLADLFAQGSTSVANLQALTKAFEKLKKLKGISKGFLESLFASGNTGLILQLADSDAATIRNAQSLFGQQNTLAAALGGNVAANSFGADLDHLGDRIEKKLDRLIKVNQHGHRETGREVGKVINGTAIKGRRDGRVAAA